MTFAVDTKLHWTDHYVEHGFAVIKNAASPDFIQAALSEIDQLLGHALPRDQWTVDNTRGRQGSEIQDLKVLPQVYAQPVVRHVIDTMFGSPDQWNHEVRYHLFISPYNPGAKAVIEPEGHIDFVNSPVPIFGSGFMFQLSLVKSEPFSGNITIYPGSHRTIQRALANNPDLMYPGDLKKFLQAEPFEFVAEPGDMLIFHHLVGHSGNANHAANRSPRVALHCQANRHTWLRELDPAAPGLCPWERSLAFTGRRYRTRRDELEWIMEFKEKAAAARKPAAAAM